MISISIRCILISVCMYQAYSASCTFKNLKAVKDWTSAYSPDYPEPFEPQTQCVWEIWAARGEKIQIEFTDLNLAKPKNKECTHQWLSIRDGLNTPGSKAPMYTICGKKTPKEIVVTRGNTVTISLSSNNALPQNADIYTGFNLRYSITTDKPANIPDEWKTYRQSKNAAPKSSLPQQTLGSIINKLRPKGPKRPGPGSTRVLGGPSETDTLAEQNRLAEERNRQIEENNRRRNEGENGIPQGPEEVYYNEEPVDEYNPPTDITFGEAKNKVTLALASTGDKKSTDGWIRAPTKKSSPALPHHMQVLLGIIGGILGFLLLAFLLKKCWWDKRNGDDNDAYNGVKQFKNQLAQNGGQKSGVLKGSVEVETPKNTMPQSDDSGVSTGKSNTNKSQKQGYDNPAMKTGKEPVKVEKPIGYIEENERTSVPRRNGRNTSPRNANTFNGAQRAPPVNNDVDRWVSNTYDERIHKKSSRGNTLNSESPPPDYYDGMTPEEIEREKRRRERRRRHRRQREEGNKSPRRGHKERHNAEGRRHHRHHRR